MKSCGFLLILFLLQISLAAQDSSAVADSLSLADTLSQTLDSSRTVAADTANAVAGKAVPAKPDDQFFNRANLIIALAMLLIALAGLWFTFRTHRLDLWIKDRIARRRYLGVLKEELSTIRMLGSPEIENLPVSLLDTFVSLDIAASEYSRDEMVSRESDPASGGKEDTGYLRPESVTKKAFRRRRMLLIIGDPGSGKTTLLKYYAMCCLNGDHRKLGFKRPVLPLFFPLRELEPKDALPEGLPENLVRWAARRVLQIGSATFYNWLHERETLVLLDGLDEISDLEQRRRICDWIDNTARGLPNARFVVTSRWTGYRKLDGVELGFEHLRADVMDFSPEQQEDFLRKWFQAVIKRENTYKPSGGTERLERQKAKAAQRAQVIIDYLNKPENKRLRDLAAVPLLLQVMAIIWKEREHLPHSRPALYNAALKYLLDFRDRRRQLDPLLPADKALRVLQPVALWMQQILHADQVRKLQMHEKMGTYLKTFDRPPAAAAFCENLRDRAGVLADLGEDAYIFRHKTFREYLAALEMIKECRRNHQVGQLAEYFGDDWWEEPLRFWMSEADETLFDHFMAVLFRSEKSKVLDAKAQSLLERLILEAPQKKTDSLAQILNDRRVSGTKKRYIIDCLRHIGSESAYKALEKFCRKTDQEPVLLDHAAEAMRSANFSHLRKEKTPVSPLRPHKDRTSFINQLEDNAEYILIPGGSFRYSVGGKDETVPDLYFAKYPLTNRRYRRFIRYLAGKEPELEARLPRVRFGEMLLGFAATVPDSKAQDTKAPNYSKYLGENINRWAELLQSGYDADKRFRGDDHPVVGVNWYAARAYCLWLSLMTLPEPDQDWKKAAGLYRLPTEPEWEWAAAGRDKDGALREYPWGNEKPDKDRANYGRMADATTPVGQYPAGATPEGLLDMAGNVLEWMENWSGAEQKFRSLRGGSWGNGSDLLRCSARLDSQPALAFLYLGFRVVCAQSYTK